MRLLRLRLLLRLLLLLLLLRLRRRRLLLPPNSRHGSRGSAACGRTRGAKPEALHFVISCSLCSVLAYVLADP